MAVAANKRDMPQINGSSNGFIALVVCLILVIIVASTGVIVLLRREWRERPNARQDIIQRKHRQYQHQQRGALGRVLPIASSSGNRDGSERYQYDEPMTDVSNELPRTGRNDASLLGKIRGLFPGSQSSRQTRASKGADGWMRTGSGDDWDSEYGDEAGAAARMQELGHNHAVYTPGTVGSPSESVSSYFPPHPLHTAMPSDISGSYNLSETPRRIPLITQSSLSAFVATPTSGNSIRSRGNSRAASPVPPPHHRDDSGISAGSTTSIPRALSEDSPSFSTHHGEMRPFAGGTKFSESIQ